MRQLELTARLRAVADLVEQGSAVADIGTDHAYLPVWLLKQGRISHAIAADLREGPLDRARTTAQQYDCCEGISFRLCDGLAGIRPDEVDTIVIAGMGGETIAAILERALWTSDERYKLLLQPMSAQPELRHWLWTHGFSIVEEQIVCEGEKLYNILSVTYGKASALSLGEEWAGRQERGMLQPLRGLYLERLLEKTQRAMDGLSRGKGEHVSTRLEELAQIRQAITTMKEEWDSWHR